MTGSWTDPLPLDLDDMAGGYVPDVLSQETQYRISALWGALTLGAGAIQRWGLQVASGHAGNAPAPPPDWTQACELASSLHDSLGLEIGRRLPDGGTIELIVTCHGRLAALPTACAVHAAAPRLPGFEIILLRPRRPPSAEFRSGDLVVSAKRMRLALGWHEASRGLAVAVRSLDQAPGTERARFGVAYAALNQVLGEQDLMGKVVTTRWMDADADADANAEVVAGRVWLTLDQFAGAFDAAWHSSKQ